MTGRTRRIHYRDDFDFIVRISSVNGIAIDPAAVDWRIKATSGAMCAHPFVAVHDGGEYRNCRIEEGAVRVVCDNHMLPPGRVKLEISVMIPDGLFPDGSRRMVYTEDAGIELVRDNGDYPADYEIEAVLPCIKGEPGGSAGGALTDDEIEKILAGRTVSASDIDALLAL